MLPGDNDARKLACLCVMRLGGLELTAEEIAKNYDMDHNVIVCLLSDLETHGMVTSNSDTYQLTDDGERVTQLTALTG